MSEVSEQRLCQKILARGGICGRPVSNGNSLCGKYNHKEGVLTKEVKKVVSVAKKKRTRRKASGRVLDRIASVLDQLVSVPQIKLFPIPGQIKIVNHPIWRRVIKKVMAIFLEEIDYLNRAFDTYRKDFWTGNMMFESDEPQIGKTHLILVMAWVERFVMGRRPMVILYNRKGDQIQLKNRIDGFNQELKEILEDLECPDFYSALKLVPFTLDSKVDEKIILDASTQKNSGSLPIIIGNVSKLTKLVNLANQIEDGSKESPVLIIDEVHSIITNIFSDKANLFSKFSDFYHQIERLKNRVIGISATGFSFYSNKNISPHLGIFVKVYETQRYLKKNLHYRKFCDYRKIPVKWNNKTIGKVNNWTENDKAEVLKFLQAVIDDQMDGKHIRKMLLLTIVIENNEQDQLKDWILAEFGSDAFEIILFNQTTNGSIDDILEQLDDSPKPIMVICRHKGTQGTTYKPTNLRAGIARQFPIVGLTHVGAMISDSDHMEHIIQYSLRANGWFSNQAEYDYQVRFYATQENIDKISRNLESKRILTNQLELESQKKKQLGQSFCPRESLLASVVSLPIENKLTRDNASDLRLRKTKHMLFKDEVSFVAFRENIKHKGDFEWVTKLVQGPKLKASHRQILSEARQRAIDVGEEGFKFNNSNIHELTKVNTDLKTFLIEIGESGDKVKLQFCHTPERVRQHESHPFKKPVQNDGRRPFDCDYIAINFEQDLDQPIKFIKYLSNTRYTQDLIVGKYYCFHRTDGNIGIFQWHPTEDQEYLGFEEK